MRSGPKLVFARGSAGATASRVLSSRWAVPAALTLLAGFVSFIQRPGEMFVDSRIEFIVNPELFLDRLNSVWTSTIDLGHIQTSQFIGYLFPMAPFFAGGDAADLPVWIVQRLWIWLLLALGAWGTARLVALLRPDSSRWAYLIPGILYMLSPFVTVSLTRGSVWLIPYALFPWMLVVTKKGLAAPRQWLWPILLALFAMASSTGVTSLVWPCLAIFGFCLFEVAFGVRWRSCLSFVVRALIGGLAVSAWWIVPVLVQFRYGTDYLTYTEHPETILHTTSASESIRMLGYWVTYVNGLRPTAEVPAMADYLLSNATVLATFVIPTVAVLLLTIKRTWRYAFFFALLMGFGVVAMAIGFPQEAANGKFITQLLYSAGPAQFMRTTYKAAPLVALASSVMCGVALGSFLALARSTQVAINGRRVRQWLLFAPALITVGLVVLFAGRPLLLGKAIDERRAFPRIPIAWTEALAFADSTVPEGSRIGVLPGDVQSWYNWGGTYNSVAPGLARNPVLIREIIRAGPPNSAQLLEATDSLIQQCRLTPGQLNPLLRVMGVGLVLVPSDASVFDSNTIGAAEVAECLKQQRGFARPIARFGQAQSFSGPPTSSIPAIDLPQVRAYKAPWPAEPRIKRVHSTRKSVIVDGDADGLITMAAVGVLNPDRALFYSADLSARSLWSAISRDGASLVFTDSNRRAPSLPGQTRARIGPTLPVSQEVPRAFPRYLPFGTSGTDVQTVAVYSGVKDIRSPLEALFTLLPAHRPFAAFDGNAASSWVAQSKDPKRQWLEVEFKKPRRLNYIVVKPHFDISSATSELTVRTNGQLAKTSWVSSGWNWIKLNWSAVRTLRIEVRTQRPPSDGALGGNPGIDEIRVPGLRVKEFLRLPTDLSSKTSALLATGSDRVGLLASTPMAIALSRVTQDFPRWTGKPTVPASVLTSEDQAAPEDQMSRIATLPSSRSFSGRGWGSVDPEASDDKVDSLLGADPSNRFRSSGRWDGLARFRASSAFDGISSTSWRARFYAFNPPWIEWRGEKPISFRNLRLSTPAGGLARPLTVRIITPSGALDRPVNRDGQISMPRRITTRRLRIAIVEIAQRLGGPVVAISELQIPGVKRIAVRSRGSLSTPCGAVAMTTKSANGSRGLLTFRISGTVPELNNGRYLHLKSCGLGSAVRLAQGPNLLGFKSPTVFRADHVVLDGAPTKTPPPTLAPARITPKGYVHLVGRGWLVLGESYSKGWRAWCRGPKGSEQSLGEPTPIDGYANGWRINGDDCRYARFAFAPQLASNWALAFSLLALAVALCVVAVAVIRRTGGRRGSGSEHPTIRRSTHSLTIFRSSIAISIARKPMSGTRQTDGSTPKTLSIVFGLSAALILTGGVLTALHPTSPQGITYDYAIERVTAHWLVLTAMLIVIVGSIVAIIVLRRRQSHPTPEPPHS